MEVFIKTAEGKVGVATDIGLDVDPSAIVALSLVEEESARVTMIITNLYTVRFRFKKDFGSGKKVS